MTVSEQLQGFIDQITGEFGEYKTVVLLMLGASIIGIIAWAKRKAIAKFLQSLIKRK